MPNQSAHISLVGDREENQDRVKVVEADGATLLLAADGMGGHMDGAAAAELAVNTIEKAFLGQTHPVFDPQGFLHLAIGNAHAALVELGAEQSLEARPRATCALCLIQDGAAYWAHVGDSRIYHLRGDQVHERSRDHSYVESLLYDGEISRAQLATHPLRNYVECCLGGDAELPRMSISTRKSLDKGDIMLVCSDGFWSPLAETLLAELGIANGTLTEALRILGETAIRAASPYSDNTSAAAYSFSGVN
jgi:serine/threonine protein phosphatase PrpC